MFNPEVIAKLQQATAAETGSTARQCIYAVYEADERSGGALCTLRGLFKFKKASETAGAAERSGAGEGNREAVLHGRDELRVDFDRGA